jgi:hypothetical protein
MKSFSALYVWDFYLPLSLPREIVIGKSVPDRFVDIVKTGFFHSSVVNNCVITASVGRIPRFFKFQKGN